MFPVESKDAMAEHPSDPHPVNATTIATWLLDFYHVLLAPILTAHSGSACRFEPSCSRYAKLAMERYGLRRGGSLAVRRLARCHPWGSYGYDPVPHADDNHQRG